MAVAGIYFGNSNSVISVCMVSVCSSLDISGFPTGVANMVEGGLSQNMDGAWWKLKMLLKNTCEGVHSIVKLLAVSLQASKFTKNELLHTYFSRILARF